MWLITPDPQGPVDRFISEAEVTLPVLLDANRRSYISYDQDELGEVYSPYPLHVVIDGEGVIRHLSTESEPETVRAVIDALLEEGDEG